MTNGPVMRICGAVPWIHELQERVPCEGFSWKRVSFRRPPGHPANRCHFLARWTYCSMDESRKILCTHHIFSHGLMADYPDIDRWEEWWAEHREGVLHG